MAMARFMKTNIVWYVERAPESNPGISGIEIAASNRRSWAESLTNENKQASKREASEWGFNGTLDWQVNYC